MLRLKRSNVTPPDLFRYRFPQDQFLVTSFDYDSWIDKIKKHATDNNYPIPSAEACENQLCRRLSGEWCDGGNEYSFVNTRFTFNDFIRGSKVLASVALSPDSIVDQQTAEDRALICSRCPVNVDVPGCKSCEGMANLIGELKGKKETKYDYLLHACGVCLCPNSVQIWVKGEHLAKGVTNEMLETYRQIDESNGCWKYREVLTAQNPNV